MSYYGNEPAKVALKIGSGVITAEEIQDASISTADIANDAITPNQLDDDGTGFQIGTLGIGAAVSGGHALLVSGTSSFSGAITGNLTGNASGSSGSTTGNAATATALATARTIGGTSFDGTANIAVGLAATATALATTRAINGVNFDGSAAITVTADANTLSNTTLKSTVVSSSLTSVGTLTSFRSTGIDDNADALAITINSSEAVGIGTNNPGQRLSVAGGELNSCFYNTSMADTMISVNTDRTLNRKAGIAFNHGQDVNGAVGESGYHMSGKIQGQITQVGNSGGGTTQKGQLLFYTNAGDNMSAALTLDSSQNAKFIGEVYVGGATGLGTAKLQVVGTQTTDLGDPQSVIYGGIVSGAYSTLGFGHIEALYPESPIEIGSKCVNTGAGGYSDFFIATRSGTSGAPTTRLTIDSDGKVGIGTTVMNKDVNFATTTQGEENKLHFEAETDSWGIYSYDRTNGHYGDLHFGQHFHAKSGGNHGFGLTAPTVLVHATTSSDSNQVALFDNTSSTGYGLRVRTTAHASSSYYTFETRNSAGSTFRVNGDGKVGIGETSPDSLLHVTASSGDPAIICETASGGAAKLKLIGTDTNMMIQSSGGLNWFTSASTTANGNERMRLTADGTLWVTGNANTANTVSPHAGAHFGFVAAYSGGSAQARVQFAGGLSNGQTACYLICFGSRASGNGKSSIGIVQHSKGYGNDCSTTVTTLAGDAIVVVNNNSGGTVDVLCTGEGSQSASSSTCMQIGGHSSHSITVRCYGD